MIDILCLVHNNLPVTQGFVDHLFRHTKSFNLIFLDNGSTDKKVKEYLEDGFSNKKWNLLKSETNLGVISGRNLLLQHTENDLCIHLDNDQYVNANWLNPLLKLYENGYHIVGVEAWRMHPPENTGTIIINGQSYNKNYFPIKKCSHSSDLFTYVGCGGMLTSKKVYDKIGLFDESFSPAYFEDPDFNFRARQNNLKIGWAYNCPIRHLAHQTFNIQKLFNKNEQFIKSWKTFQQKWNNYFPALLCMKEE